MQVGSKQSTFVVPTFSYQKILYVILFEHDRHQIREIFRKNIVNLSWAIRLGLIYSFLLFSFFFLTSFDKGSFNYIADKRAGKYSYKSNGLLS